MIRDRGYSGSVEQLRRVVARLRPQSREAFLRLQVFPAEQAQVDWAYFGSVVVGRAKRQLSCFVITLSWSRALYLELFFDQTDGEFPAWPRARLSRLVRRTPSRPVRQSQKRRAGTPRRPDSFQPAAAGTGRSLSLRATPLPSTRGKSKGSGFTLHSFGRFADAFRCDQV
jgi:transposase